MLNRKRCFDLIFYCVCISCPTLCRAFIPTFNVSKKTFPIKFSSKVQNRYLVIILWRCFSFSGGDFVCQCVHISLSCRSICSTVVCYVLQFGGLYPLNITALLGGLASHHLSLWTQHPPTEVFQVFSFGLKANDQRKHFQCRSIDQQWV